MPPDSGPPARLRVVVVDADDRVRQSLAGLLRIGGRLEVIGSAGQCDEAFDLVLATRPDIVVVDPRLPEVDAGMRFIRRLRTETPATRILVMNSGDGSEPCEAADGCVRKTFRPSDLVAAVLAAAG